jgi:lycopene cyclase domain-containing protein
MSLYLWIIVGTICGPFFLSFDKKVAFYKDFKFLIPSIFTIGFIFIVWDIYFTENKIWGFTPEYLSGIYFFNLPVEECLFFLVVPFACVFIHQVLKAYFPNYNGKKFAHFFAFGFTFSGLLFGVMNLENWYTSSACIISAILTIGIYFRFKVEWYRNFVLTYCVALIPFLLVNGILTGAITENPIVWYNENHIMGIRIITIPLEDLYYNYSMLLPIVAIFEFLKNRKVKIVNE